MRVYVDTNVLIRGMERTDDGAGEVGRMMDLAETGKLTLVTSELTLSELLVGPLRSGDALLAGDYEALLTHERRFDLAVISRSILIASAHIRANSSARLPDSVHVATAVQGGCDFIVSYDRRLGGLSELDVIEPSDMRFDALDKNAP
jgi:predicted nucleic acid-binding protein